MRWNDDKGNEFNNLYETDIKTINSYEWAFFVIEFHGMSEMETSNTMFYMENQKTLNVLDFMQWLFDRGISFKLRYRYFDKISFVKNIKAFLIIIKLNFKKLIMELKKED